MTTCGKCGTELFRIQGCDGMESVAQAHTTARCNDMLVANIAAMTLERNEWKETSEFRWQISGQFKTQLDEALVQLKTARAEIDRLQDECVLMIGAEDERDAIRIKLTEADAMIEWMQPVFVAAVKWRRKGGMAYKAVYEAVEAALKKRSLPAESGTTP